MADVPTPDYLPEALGRRFPPCRVCGAWPTGLRPHYDEQLLVAITLDDCGHTIGVPWEAAVGLG